MLATQNVHSSCYECSEELSLFLDTPYEQTHSSQVSKKGSKQSCSQRIVSLSDDVVVIKGTLSVAF